MNASRSFVEEHAHLPVIDLAFLRARRSLLEAIKRRHGVARLRVFGSVARGDARPDSDVDFVVEMEPGADRGWGLSALYADLAALVDGRRIDLAELDERSRPAFREAVEREAVEL